MTPTEFLRAVWPDAGPYCLAYQIRPRQEGSRSYWKHLVVDSAEEAITTAAGMSHKYDMYFAVLGLHERQKLDLKQKDPRTGEPGKIVVRTHANMRASKAQAIDVDVGEDKPYQTQAAAALALKQWVTTNQLPVPTIVSSGRGLHVYWLMDGEVSADDWRSYGEHIQALADHQGFGIDSSRSSDPSSVLRIPGTLNLKSAPLPVTIFHVGVVTPVTTLQRLLRDAVTRAGVSISAKARPSAAASEWGESNLKVEFSGSLPTLKEVITACAQTRRMVELQGNLSEAAWYKAHLNTVKWCEDGHRLAHVTSQGYARYSAAETDTKLSQLDNFAPATCETIAECMPEGASLCQGCPFLNDTSVRNPLVAARKLTVAPAPVLVETVAGETVTATTIPNPPFPYTRLKEGGISRKGKNADGDDVIEVIYPYDLYPIRRLTNPDLGIEQQQWCVHLPISGRKVFLVEASALYDIRKFTETIASQGIYPSKSNVPYLQEYMTAYISELQKLVDADVQSSHLGWVDEYRQFILPDRVLQRDGSVKPALLTNGAQIAAANVKQLGTLERQVELMHFYDNPKYVAHQVFILGGLASTLLQMTNQHGLIVNASGAAGSSKSTALYTACSNWGEPENYAINGTNDGATTKGRNERVSTMANLPVGVDEVTHMPAREVQNLAMYVTQPTGRLRLKNDGTERKTGSDYKSTIMLTTANSSLHNMLSLDNAAGTAGSMRVFEIEFRLAGVHEKHEADHYLRELKKNYGHIGPAFAAYVVRNYEKVEKRVHAVLREVDRKMHIDASERFWSAYVACVLVTLEICQKLHLLSWDRAHIEQWLAEVQLPYMRGVVVDEYNEPMAVLANYLESISGNILFVEQTAFSGASEPYVRTRVHGALLAHYEIAEGRMYVLKDGFKRYCQKIGASMHKVLCDLHAAARDVDGTTTRVVPERTMRKVLGAGTEYAKTQSYCFVVDMRHPGVSDGPHPLLKNLPSARRPDMLLASSEDPGDS